MWFPPDQRGMLAHLRAACRAITALLIGQGMANSWTRIRPGTTRHSDRGGSKHLPLHMLAGPVPQCSFLSVEAHTASDRLEIHRLSLRTFCNRARCTIVLTGRQGPRLGLTSKWAGPLLRYRTDLPVARHPLRTVIVPAAFIPMGVRGEFVRSVGSGTCYSKINYRSRF
jgi:hypothetical protein